MIKNRVFPVAMNELESFRQFAERLTGWEVKDSHIRKIKVRSFSDRIKRQINSDICVGQELDTNLSNIPGEPVLAIFESKEYLVITPDKSNLKATVYLFDQSEVLDIEKE